MNYVINTYDCDGYLIKKTTTRSQKSTSVTYEPYAHFCFTIEHKSANKFTKLDISAGYPRYIKCVQGDTKTTIDLDDVGRIDKIYRYKDGEYHHDTMPAVVIYSNGVKERETYYKNRQMHRGGDLPAQIAYSDGKIVKESYYTNDKHHRDNDRPAIIKYDFSGKIIEESYYKEGELHRDKDQPAIIKYDRYEQYWCKGKLPALTELGDQSRTLSKLIEYYVKGIRHRDSDLGPAQLEYNPTTGQLLKEIYWVNGVIHRGDNKPAVTVYNSEGKLLLKIYALEGKIGRTDDGPSCEVQYYNQGHDVERTMRDLLEFFDTKSSRNGYYDAVVWSGSRGDWVHPDYHSDYNDYSDNLDLLKSVSDSDTDSIGF